MVARQCHEDKENGNIFFTTWGVRLNFLYETGDAVCVPELHTSCILEGLYSLLHQNIDPGKGSEHLSIFLSLKWDCGINVCHGGSMKL